MDAPCEIQGSIHVFRLVNNMCPGKWVHIIVPTRAFVLKTKEVTAYAVTSFIDI